MGLNEKKRPIWVNTTIWSRFGQGEIKPEFQRVFEGRWNQFLVFQLVLSRIKI
jgi:hypothetical protein